jgi:hypothetical protein
MTCSRVLCLAGSIGAGKTRISTAVAEALRWRRAGFGDFIRSIATQRGLDHSRETLQRVGEGELQSQGWERFCEAMLAWSGWGAGQPLVIDGVRHAEVLHALRKVVAPTMVSLVFLRTGVTTRTARLSARGDIAGLDPDVLTNSTEEQVETVLPGLADLCVDANRSVDTIVESIVTWLQNESG